MMSEAPRVVEVEGGPYAAPLRLRGPMGWRLAARVTREGVACVEVAAPLPFGLWVWYERGELHAEWVIGAGPSTWCAVPAAVGRA